MADFYKATIVNELAKNSTDGASIAEAFRSPPPGATAKEKDGLRLRVHPDQTLTARRIRETGWAAFWAIFFPNATVVELSGRINVTLKIYPTHVQIEKRRWFSSTGMLARYSISIPVYDEVGDVAVHQLHARSELAFLYPFVPMHIEIALDEEAVFGQGKFHLDIT